MFELFQLWDRFGRRVESADVRKGETLLHCWRYVVSVPCSVVVCIDRQSTGTPATQNRQCLEDMHPHLWRPPFPPQVVCVPTPSGCPCNPVPLGLDPFSCSRPKTKETGERRRQQSIAVLFVGSPFFFRRKTEATVHRGPVRWLPQSLGRTVIRGRFLRMAGDRIARVYSLSMAVGGWCSAVRLPLGPPRSDPTSFQDWFASLCSSFTRTITQSILSLPGSIGRIHQQMQCHP